MRTMMLLAMMILGGCADRALQVASEAGASPSKEALCVWHFTSPTDTSDSDATPGVANCDSSSFRLDDGVLDIAIQRDGVAMFSGAAIPMQAIGSDATSWCVDLVSDTVHGMVCVNLR